MSRKPRNHRLGVGDSPPNAVLGDEPPTEIYPLRRGGRAVPDRSQPPDIGAACHDTRKVSPQVSTTEELRSGVATGSPTENTRTRQEHGNDVTEYRHGQRTRPPRPGAWG